MSNLVRARLCRFRLGRTLLVLLPRLLTVLVLLKGTLQFPLDTYQITLQFLHFRVVEFLFLLITQRVVLAQSSAHVFVTGGCKRRGRSRTLVPNHVQLAVGLALEIVQDRLARRRPLGIIYIVASRRAPLTPVRTVYAVVRIECKAHTPPHFLG